MSFGGPPVTVQTVEEADELLLIDEKESAIGMYAFSKFLCTFKRNDIYIVFFISEAEVLAAPLKLVYSKLILRYNSKYIDRNSLSLQPLAVANIIVRVSWVWLCRFW